MVFNVPEHWLTLPLKKHKLSKSNTWMIW